MIKAFYNLSVSKVTTTDSNPDALTYTVDGVENGSYVVDGEFVTFSDPSSVFDRSNASNFSDSARSGYYDGGTPTKWHYSELNIDTVTSWLINEERIYFAPANNMSEASEINTISTFTTTRTGAAAISEHANIGHILLTDSEASVLLDSDNLPLWDN